MKSEKSKRGLTPNPSPKGEGSRMKFGYKLKKESLTPNPSPKGEGSRMKSG